MASGVAAARLTAAPDSILTFNRTVSLSSGLFQWFPKGEFGPVSDGVTVWTVSYSGIPGGGTGWNNAKVGEGNPIYQYSAPSIRGYTPGVTVELPIEAIYYEGDFVPWNGDDPNMLIIKKNQDDPTRMTLPGYVRYYDNIPKFQQNELYFGVDDGIKGGGNFTVRNVTMTMSIIST
jgi:hypothetical protein